MTADFSRIRMNPLAAFAGVELQRGRVLERLLEQGEPIHRLHLQVGQQQVVRALGQQRERLFTAARLVDREALCAQEQRGGRSHVPLVVDNEQAASGVLGVERGCVHTSALTPPLT